MAGLSPHHRCKLVPAGPAGRGWSSGPEGWTAQSERGRGRDTVWAWRPNRVAAPAAAVNPEEETER